MAIDWVKIGDRIPTQEIDGRNVLTSHVVDGSFRVERTWFVIENSFLFTDWAHIDKPKGVDYE